MTSETRLREIAAEYIRDCLDDVADDARTEKPDDLHNVSDDEADRVAAMIRAWPILDQPVLDEDGYLFPMHGRNFGHVRVTTIYDPRLNTTDRGNLDPFKGVIIGRGGPGRASRHTSMTLTKAEALELAALLTAAAMEEA